MVRGKPSLKASFFNVQSARTSTNALEDVTETAT